MVASPQNAGDGGTTAPKETTYSDASGAIFSMYIDRAQKFDKENVDNWDGQANGILVFTGLFSSTVATFIAMSYPNLQQDCNVTTQSLLVTISQQLASTNGTILAASPCTQNPPSAPVVFVNSVWFLSLVLSLTCALIATLLQQWARRYLQMIQRNHAPHVRAHIREYFSRGARRFRIIGLVEVLPFLLLISVLLFFAGLVVFAFLANHTVAFITAAIVGICLISYIGLSLTPLRHHDCPYYTPFTSLIWYSAQIIPFSYFSVLYHATKQLHDRWGAVDESTVKSFHDRQMNKAMSFSEGRISTLENSAKGPSMDIYKKTLIRMLYWLTEDHELEGFVAGIPGLCESDAFAARDNGDTQRTIYDVLTVLPGPTSFHASLPWCIIRLAQRAFTRNLPKIVQQRRTRACLKALYYIPGAIRDVLAPYAAGEHYCLEILPLLNSPESLAIIDELWDTPNGDVALSVRCAAAVVTAFMITPPRRTLEKFVTGTQFIWEDDAGQRFLSKRLGICAGTDGGAVPESDRDSARLQNLVRFLEDIRYTLRYMNTRWWTSVNAGLISQERRELFDTRHTAEYRTGRGTFDQKGDRASPAFVPAAQQDLITLTLEILARDSVANAATSQREAFRGAYMELSKEALVQTRLMGQEGIRAVRDTQAQAPEGLELEAVARVEVQVVDSFEVARSALKPVLQSLQMHNMPAPHGDPPSQILVLPVASTDSTDSRQASAGAGSARKPSPLSTEGVPSLQYSVSSNSAAPSSANRDPDTSSRAGVLV